MHSSIVCEKAGVAVDQQRPITVHDEDGTLLGEYFADLVVCDVLVVELKAARSLSSEHEAQLLGYLRSTRIEHGLLINFGSYRFQIRKYARSCKEALSPPTLDDSDQ